MNIRKQLLSVFGVSLVLTLVLSGVFVNFSGKVSTGLSDLHSYQRNTADELENFRDAELVLLNDAWEMKYLDESLTHTIVRYIQSDGQGYWDTRYQAQTAELNEAMASAVETASDKDQRIIERVQSAGLILSEYDADIRAKVAAASVLKDEDVKEAELKAAENILYGDYEIQKAIYHGGMREFFIKQQERLEESVDLRVAEAYVGMVKAQDLISEAKKGQQQATALIGAIVVVNAVLALRFSNSLTSRIGRLQEISHKLSIGEMEGLKVDIRGDDEIGELGEAMKGVIAAFNTMLTGFDSIDDTPSEEPEVELVDVVDAVDEVEVR